MDEEVDYVMAGPFVDALPAGCYQHAAVGTLHVKTRYAIILYTHYSLPTNCMLNM
jgi:hypothetical protein